MILYILFRDIFISAIGSKFDNIFSGGNVIQLSVTGNRSVIIKENALKF